MAADVVVVAEVRTNGMGFAASFAQEPKESQTLVMAVGRSAATAFVAKTLLKGYFAAILFSMDSGFGDASDPILESAGN